MTNELDPNIESLFKASADKMLNGTFTEHVMAEVETKVRSLARQKGRAQRFLQLRARRLDVEVTVVQRRLGNLHTRLATVESELSSDGVVTATCTGLFVAVKPGHPAYSRW